MNRQSLRLPTGCGTFIALSLAFAGVFTIESHAIGVPCNSFVVNSIADDSDSDLSDDLCNTAQDECTLRAAIEQANMTNNVDADTPDEIGFDLLGPSVHTIRPLSPLPSITEAVRIDGYTQGTAEFNTLVEGSDALLKIEIDGSLAGQFIHGLTLESNGSTIRGLVINRFGGANIWFESANENHIEGNYIGTDATGMMARPNGADGIALFSSASNVIGGASPDMRNVISGNAWSGVAILNGSSQSNIVEGNYIGTDPSGLNNVGNGRNGVLISAVTGVNTYATMNRVGGVGVGQRNIISGNGWSGVQVFRGTKNEILGNLIGTKVDGATRLPNQNDGVLLNEASDNLVGGQFVGDGSGTIAAFKRNILSGNNGRGVTIFVGSRTASGNRVVGNYIGTDITGQLPVPNNFGGVLLGSGVGATGTVTGNIIGGTDGPGASRNIISGNGSSGVSLVGPMVTGNDVVGNYIGLDKTGTAKLGNDFDGVRFTTFGAQTSGPSGNFIGTTAPNSRNVISGNGRDGVAIAFGSSGNFVLQNYIGLDHLGTGTDPNGIPGVGDEFGNTRHGVFIGNGSSGNSIGGTASDEGNVIAFNGMSGVAVESGTGNAIRGNQIFENDGQGIDLGGDGFTENDAGDGDSGPNGLQNFPIVTVEIVGTRTEITIDIDSEPNTTYSVDIYSDEVSHDVFGVQGRSFLATLDFTTDDTSPSGLVFSQQGVHHNISVTLTDPNGNTSEIGREQLVHSVEFTQAIQIFQPLDELLLTLEATGEPPVPMIAGKPGVMRVYIRELSDKTDVKYEVEGLGFGFTQQTIEAGPGCTPMERRRMDPAAMRKCWSADFYFCDPPQGQWTTVLTLKTPSGDVFERHRIRQTTRDSVPLVLKAVEICHSVDGSGNWECGHKERLDEISGFLRAIAPTSEVRVEVTNDKVRRRISGVDLNGDGDLFDRVGNTYENVAWENKIVYDLADLFTLVDFFTTRDVVKLYYVGVTNSLMTRAAGMASEIGGFGAFVHEQTLLGPFPGSTEVFDIAEYVVAHEVFHMLKRRHTNRGQQQIGPPPYCFGKATDSGTDWPYCSNLIQSGLSCGAASTPEVGFDVKNRCPLLPEVTYDVMSYCTPIWITPFTYLKLANDLLAPKTSSAIAHTALGSVPIDGAFWLITGDVENGTATFEPLFQFDTTGLDSLGAGSHRIEIRDASEVVLSTRMFDPMIAVVEGNDPVTFNPPHFSELILVQLGASSIVMLDDSDVEVGRITLAGITPIVTVDYSPGGQPQIGSQIIKWTILDSDSSVHTVWVQYSNDNGLTWHNVTIFAPGSQLQLNFDDLPGADGASIFRVIASDGVNTGFGDSAPFSVAKKLPQVGIYSPEDGTVYRRGQLVWLQASASDGDDGSLNDAAVVWTSSLVGDVGQGRQLQLVSLGVGVHTMTVEATDSDGNMVTDSITITVEDSALVETTAVINVPADEPTIQAAIDVSLSGDEIIVAPGTYAEIIDFNGKAITLRSSGGASVTIIDATNVADPGDGKPVVRCDSGESANTVLDGFTITGGTGANDIAGGSSGGGMFINGSSPTVVNCKFIGNSAVRGGGMHTLSSSATVTDCTFIANSADSLIHASSGAGMHNQDSGNLVITGCTFNGNITPIGSGGGMYNLRCDNLVVSDCAFIGNESRFGGGVNNLNASDQLFVGCTFLGNTAISAGGGMTNVQCTDQTVIGCTFSENSCTNSVGGGMSNSSVTNQTVSDCDFNGNTARTGGGGMFNPSGIVTGCTFRENRAISSSGGGMLNATSDVLISDCVFIGNMADQNGGAMTGSDTTTVSRCVFSGNTAGGTGGGMHNNSGSPTVTDSVFSGNVAFEGGGVYNRSSAPTLTNCTFSRNSADVGGGMFGVEFSGAFVTNCIFWMNSDLGGTDESGQIHNDDTFGPNSPTVNFSDIQGGWTGLGGTGNINIDPLFMDADGPDNQVGTEDDDLQLQPGSPCIDSGDPAFVATPGETDLDGHDRVLCTRVEMGAYEFAGDFACDQTIDLNDFANWDACMTGPDAGPYVNECAAFDCDADLDIDMKDFAEFAIIFSP